MKALLFFFLTILPLFGQNAQEIVDQSGLKLLTPSLAERKTKKIRLSNNLEAYLIFDKTTTHSAAALAVGVGSGDDLDTRPGIAHFVEHLLFMGNEKYPNEEDFSLFLDRFGGQKNACTASDRTVYMFSCSNAGFFEGLDHLANFFQAPLFTPSALKRECKAVHQEFVRNVTIDDWRMLHLKKHLSTNHSFHRFCIGNLDTLSDVSPQEVRSWYDEHYSANIMKLCVYSNVPLDQLEEEVIKCFSPIKNIDWKRKQADELLSIKPAICLASPLQGQSCLEISWPILLPSEKRLENHIDHLLSYVLGHEGADSLFSQLKTEQLGYKIECGTQKISQNQSYFVISIGLTQKGVEQYESVISKVYEAINGLKNEGISKHVFDELKAMRTLAYEYQTRSDLFEFVFTQAAQLIDEPLESYPRKTLIPSSFEPEAMQELLSSLLPERGLYLLLADPLLTGIPPTKEEKWLKVAYSDHEIKEELMLNWKNKKAIHVHPAPNPFIPINLEKKQRESSNQLFSFEKEWQEPKGHLYSVKDHTFLTPEVFWKIHLKSPQVSLNSVKSLVLSELFTSACEELLNEKFYAAKLASLNFSLSPETDGFSLEVSGFEEKASLLLEGLTEELLSFRFTKEVFALTRESLLTEYDLKLSSAMDHAQEGVKEIIFENHTTFAQKKEALQELSFEEANSFLGTLFQSTYLEATLFGNSSEDPELLWKEIVNKFAHSPFPKEEHLAKKTALFALKEPCSIEKISKHPAGALILTLDFGAFDQKKRAAQQILSKAMQEPFFDELRTKQQTAYVVKSWDQEIEKHLYNFFAILSSSHDPKDLLSRSECFLESFVQNLEEKHLTKERFEDIKDSSILRLKSPQLNFAQIGALVHELLFEYEDLDWLKKRENAFQELTYEECIQIAYQELARTNPKRIAVIVNGTYPENLFHYEASSIKNLKEKLDYRKGS